MSRMFAKSSMIQFLAVEKSMKNVMMKKEHSKFEFLFIKKIGEIFIFQSYEKSPAKNLLRSLCQSSQNGKVDQSMSSGQGFQSQRRQLFSLENYQM